MHGPFVAFVGIGNMGWPMAARIACAGFELGVADASRERAERFAGEYRASCAPLSELAVRCDVLVTMLPTSDIVEQILFGESGASDSLRPSTLLLEMSSGVPSKTQAIAQRLAAADIHVVDAPVSGGVRRAEAGELAIMVGGSPADVERARPLLSCMGTSILPTGDVGSAHAMKALNNLVSGAGLIITTEALLIGKKFGLDPSTMVDVLNASTGMNNSTQKKLKQFILSRAFNSGFGLDLMLKDLTIALDLAKDTQTAVPLASVCRELWASASNSLGPGRDHTEVAKLIETLGGATL
jgi:3-hydroxyisobutyrate dehydrogenase